MQVECFRICSKQMVVHGRDLQACFDHLAHNRTDLRLEQDEVAHRHNAAVRRLECYPTAERQSRFDLDSVECDGEIAAREAVSVHVPSHGGASAENAVDLLPVGLLGGSS